MSERVTALGVGPNGLQIPIRVDASGRLVTAGGGFDPAAPGPIGGTTPAAITGTTITATIAFVGPSGTQNATVFNFGTAGTGIHGSGGDLFYAKAGVNQFAIFVNQFSLVSGSAFGWSSGDPQSDGKDIGLSRISAGLLGIGTGAAGSFAGDVSLRSAILTAGVGAGRPVAMGKLSINTTAVGNITTGEDVLQTYDLPLDSFNAAGKGVHITAWGFTANNGNAKTVKLYFGSVILTNALQASIAGVWRIEADVFSTGTDAQDYITQLVTTGTAGVALNDLEKGSLTENDGAAITIKTTGEAVDTNDIVAEGLLITFLN